MASVGFLDEREGHHSSRRLILAWITLVTTVVIVVGLRYQDLAIIGTGAGLFTTILTTMQWGKSIEKGNGKAPSPPTI